MWSHCLLFGIEKGKIGKVLKRHIPFHNFEVRHIEEVNKLATTFISIWYGYLWWLSVSEARFRACSVQMGNISLHNLHDVDHCHKLWKLLIRTILNWDWIYTNITLDIFQSYPFFYLRSRRLKLCTPTYINSHQTLTSTSNNHPE